MLKMRLSGTGLLRIILAAPEACILRTQTREGTMRFCRMAWLGVARGLWALLFAATLLALLAGSNTVGTSSQTPDRFNLDRIGS